MLFPLVAGLYYWLPHFTGRMPSERLARWGFWLTFIGFNGTFLLMHLTGLLGMPRRVYTYDAGLGWDLPNLVSSVFGFVLAFGTAHVLLDLALLSRIGRRAPPNPWQADTLEWAMPMPPPSYNLASLPPLSSRHPLWADPGLPVTIAAGRHALPQAAHGRRETLGSDPVSGRPREVIHLPANSYLPVIAASLLALVCVSLLFKAYVTAAVIAAGVVLVLLRWSWENGLSPSTAMGEAYDLPAGLALHSRTFDGPGAWGMGVTLLADSALYGSLLFAWLFLWTEAPAWQPPVTSPVGIAPMAVAGIAFAIGWQAVRAAVVRLRRGEGDGLGLRLAISAVAGAAGTMVLGRLFATAPLAPGDSAHDAILSFALLFLGVHAALATAISALQVARVALGYVSVKAPCEPGIVGQLHGFVAAITAIGWVVFALGPLAF